MQIAAVRNQDDAKLLSDALQKQQYPVIIAQPGDKLFHVQVGPYADIKEAEAIRSRLVSCWLQCLPQALDRGERQFV